MLFLGAHSRLKKKTSINLHTMYLEGFCQCKRFKELNRIVISLKEPPVLNLFRGSQRQVFAFDIRCCGRKTYRPMSKPQVSFHFLLNVFQKSPDVGRRQGAAGEPPAAWTVALHQLRSSLQQEQLAPSLEAPGRPQQDALTVPSTAVTECFSGIAHPCPAG